MATPPRRFHGVADPLTEKSCEGPQASHATNGMGSAGRCRDKGADMKFPSWLPPLLGFLTAVGPISTDMYLPAFPAIEAALGGEPGTAQITLAAWFAGLAVGQITQGALSDRFGRRLPLLAATATYTL